jgi:CRISPR/Cas system-associated exonuclease Cas4 (RecB family)
MFCGGPAVDSPTIAAAINGGFPLLLVCCNGCDAQRPVDLRNVRRPRGDQVHLMEAALFCEACSTGRRRQRAHVLWLDAESNAMKISFGEMRQMNVTV